VITTTNYSLKKPVDADNADLKVFVGDNMDILDTELAKKVDKDAVTGKVKETDLPVADADSLGAVKVGAGLTVAGDGTLSASGNTGDTFGKFQIQFNATTGTLDFIYIP
jgi:hypothetical protein